MKPLTLGAGRFDVDVESWTFGAGWERRTGIARSRVQTPLKS